MFAAAFFKKLNTHQRNPRIQIRRAGLVDHPVHPVIHDHRLAVNQQSGAVVRPKIEGVSALLFDLKFALNHEAKIIAFLGEVGVGNPACGLPGLYWLELFKIRQLAPRPIVDTITEFLQRTLGHDAPGGWRRRSIAK